MKLLRLFSFGIIFPFLLASCAERSQMPAKPFEGTITEAIQVPGIGSLMNGSGDSSGQTGSGLSALGALANIGLKMYVRENKVAYDVSMLGGLITMHSIIDRDARTMTMLLPNNTAMVMDLRALDTSRQKIDDSLRAHLGLFDSLEAALPQPTGRHETIHGLDAEEYHGQKGTVETEMWLSSDSKLQAFDVVRDAFLGRGTAGTGGLDEVFGMIRPIAGKIPVKFETKVNGKTFVKGELTDISEEKIDDAVFEIPQGYQVVNGDSVRAAHAERHNVTAP
ncbi:MAG TPA: DUF4412 domain-containing protein [Candidatus Kapabacteria bacterium]|nr:DUF4412 domain-containing protein [Candidatus Kapabacteria bacterium]